MVPKGKKKFFFFFFCVDSEKQGSIVLSNVAGMKVEGEELHVLSKSGRVYLLRLSQPSSSSSASASASDELLRVWTHWQQWLAYVRSFQSSSSSSLSVKRVPSLSLPLMSSDTASSSSSHLSQPPSPGENPAPLRKDSPRKENVMKLVHEVRSRFGTSSSKSVSKIKLVADSNVNEEASSLDDDEPFSATAELASVMDFSLLQSMQPLMSLFFVLSNDSLVGYADETKAEAVEAIALDTVSSAVATSADRFELYLRNGEKLYFGGVNSSAAKWADAVHRRIKEEIEELEEPVHGSCILDLDFAEEVSVRRASIMLGQASVNDVVLDCPVCGSSNARDSARCAECGSSDGYVKNVGSAASSISPAAMSSSPAPTPPPKPKRLPPQPPSSK